MNFGGPKPEAMMPPPAGPQEGAPRPNAAPPPCPRCELVKSQCTKTVINYQKSHRKKMEALRSEIKSSRQQVARLQRQLRVYKVTSWAVPGGALIAAAGWLLSRVLRGRRERQGAAGVTAGQPEAAGSLEAQEQQEQGAAGATQ
ncbi:hypothetical protein GPECTOR_15g483 [Gonium pectorale]|uniref:Uncharacterized protein n=1 Tax=Gonium pectorale TaxID=33097 RepID=A0A150GLX1_GONPE|nr:hypothetical protein GPECTOR_15g483 [Gonium pectorale]|eukprot:KXZ50797.1 hypothetical protein GPECTOR_15g483 [Gonium pectorale]